MDAGILSIGAAVIAAGGAIAQTAWRASDERRREEEAERRKEAEAERKAISRRLGVLEAKAAAHDVADAKHDQALLHLTSTLDTIKSDLRDVRTALLGGAR